MSHFTSVETKMHNKAHLKAALVKGGYQIEECETGQVTVNGFMDETLSAEFKIRTKTKYDIGFVKNAQGNYEIVGDWELLPHVSGIEQESFTHWLKKEYALTSITQTAANMGLTLGEMTESEDGTIELIAQSNY